MQHEIGGEGTGTEQPSGSDASINTDALRTNATIAPAATST